MKLVPIDRYWHSHEYQMSSLALVLQWWIPAEFLIEWPSNETAGHISGSNSFSSNLKFYQLFHLLFVKWTEKIRGEKRISREMRGKNVTHHRHALRFSHNSIQYIQGCDSSLQRVYQKRWIFYTFPNKAICLIIRRELGCLVAKGKG